MVGGNLVGTLDLGFQLVGDLDKVRIGYILGLVV